jgi:hypothetical protein
MFYGVIIDSEKQFYLVKSVGSLQTKVCKLTKDNFTLKSDLMIEINVVDTNAKTININSSLAMYRVG